MFAEQANGASDLQGSGCPSRPCRDGAFSRGPILGPPSVARTGWLPVRVKQESSDPRHLDWTSPRSPLDRQPLPGCCLWAAVWNVTGRTEQKGPGARATETSAAAQGPGSSCADRGAGPGPLNPRPPGKAPRESPHVHPQAGKSRPPSSAISPGPAQTFWPKPCLEDREPREAGTLPTAVRTTDAQVLLDGFSTAVSASSPGAGTATGVSKAEPGDPAIPAAEALWERDKPPRPHARQSGKRRPYRMMLFADAKTGRRPTQCRLSARANGGSPGRTRSTGCLQGREHLAGRPSSDPFLCFTH